jgi:hypothetical protein
MGNLAPKFNGPEARAAEARAAEARAAEARAAEARAAEARAAEARAAEARAKEAAEAIIKWVPVKYDGGCSKGKPLDNNSKKEQEKKEEEEEIPELVMIKETPVESYVALGKINEIKEYLAKNGAAVDRTISDTKTFISTARHTSECRDGIGNTNDEKKVIGLENYLKLITKYNTTFDGYQPYRRDIIADTRRVEKNLSIRTDTYNTTMVEEHIKKVDPIKEQIKVYNNNISKIEEKLNYVYTQLENFKINEIDNDFKGYNKTMSDYVEKVKIMNNNFKGQDKSNKLILYNGIITENLILSDKIYESETTSVSNVRESNFLNDITQNYTATNSYLFYTYYGVLLFAIYLLFTVNITMNLYVKISLAILLAIYPFILEYVQPYIFYIFDILFSFATIKVYKDPGDKYSTSIDD